MNNKLISVIIPVYNGEEYIGRCLRSLLSQSIGQEEFEIVLINDGSFDNTEYALKLFKGGIIRVFNNEENMGLPYSLNKGISKSFGKFIVRVDADDYVNKDFLLIMKKFLEMDQLIDAVSCDYELIDSEENIISVENSTENPIGCGIMFRKEQLIKIGMYDSRMKYHEEKDLLIRFKKNFSIHRIALPLYRYRKHENNMTNDKKKVEEYNKKLHIKHKGR
tara:strand:- start:6 stop:665 length:660 start_codon:yes stop_codon:yes gene_type:complete